MLEVCCEIWFHPSYSPARLPIPTPRVTTPACLTTPTAPPPCGTTPTTPRLCHETACVTTPRLCLAPIACPIVILETMIVAVGEFTSTHKPHNIINEYVTLRL